MSLEDYVRGYMGGRDIEDMTAEDAKMILKGLMQGADIPLERVKSEICPDCDLRQPVCDMMMEAHLSTPGIGFVCKGMRRWVAKTN